MLTRRRCRWIPFYRRLAATRCRSPFGSFGGVCFCALPCRPTGAPSIHSPSSENISRADNLKALPLENILEANDPKALPLETILEAADAKTLQSDSPTRATWAQAPRKDVPTRRLFAQTPPMDSPTGRLFAQTPSSYNLLPSAAPHSPPKSSPIRASACPQG